MKNQVKSFGQFINENVREADTLYTLEFDIDFDWARRNGPTQTEVDLVNAVSEFGQVVDIDLTGEFSGSSIEWTASIDDLDAELPERRKPNGFPYSFVGSGSLEFTSELSLAELEGIISQDYTLNQIHGGHFELRDSEDSADLM